MAKYKIMIDGQKYKISLSDATDYTVKDNNPTEDIIKYRVEIDENNPWEGIIYAHIENPSEHTLYLIEQDRCYITINCRNFRGHGAVGNHMNEWGVPGGEHTSGNGRGSYHFHKNWSLCLESYSLLNDSFPIKVTDINDIEIPFHYQISRYKPSWSSQYYYNNVNVHGYSSLERYSDYYGEPEREKFYFDFRLALLSNQSPRAMYPWSSHMRVYQTKSKITRITFER